MNAKLYLPKTPWKGTFRQLLPRIKEHPALVESAKARLLRLIDREGENEIRSNAIKRIYGRDSLTAYAAFSMFHGIEPSIHTVSKDYLLAAAKGAEPDKQAMVLIGPPGSGKSDFVNRIKALYRQSEPVPYNGFCPVHDNPLSLLYMIRTIAENKAEADGGEDFEKTVLDNVVGILEDLGFDKVVEYNSDVLNVLKSAEKSLRGIATLTGDDFVSALVYGLGLPRSTRNIIGPPCPYCRDLILGVHQRPGKPVAIGDFPIQSMRFTTDFEGSGGIVDVPEVQPLNFDISTWIGSENLGLMGRVDPQDPRSVRLDGAFNKGNRGLVILTEGLKNPPEAQRILLEALQGRRVGLPAPLTGSIFFDGLILLHSNEGEYNKFINDKVNEPYADRFWRIWFPYPLELSEARKVTEKLWKSSEFAKPVAEGGVHLEPMLLNYAARLEVLTRIEDHPAVPRNVKVDAYDGRDVRSKGMGTKITVEDLRNAATAREGLEGMSPRETAKVINAIAAEMIGRGNCVTSRAYRDRLAQWFKSNVNDEKKRERLMGFLGNELDEARRREAQRIVLASLIEGFKDECQSTWDRYLDNISAYARNQSVRRSGGYSSGPVGGDETFMREIESDPDWGVTSAEAPKFRAEILAAVNQFITEKRMSKVPFTCHEAVRRCIERFVLKKVRSSARLFSSASARTDEDRKKLSAAKQRLIDDYGFCPHCAEELLREAEENQDFLVEK